MYKPSFTVATIVVCILTFLGLASQYLLKHIPAPPTNRLALESAEYLMQGDAEPVDWYPYGDEAFALARRTGKPILMLVGTTWSKFARSMDHDVFPKSEVSRYLSRNFVCIRVDGVENPEWMSAFLPLGRIRAGFLPGFQGWVLDPSGRVIDFIGRNNFNTKVDDKAFLDMLVQGKSSFDESQSLNPGAVAPGEIQRQDIQRIQEGHAKLVPPFSGYAMYLSGRIHPKFGGFPSRGTQQLFPNALRYLLLVGRRDDFDRALDPMLFTSIVDLMDGGFFRLSETPDWRTINFDKLACVNAEMMGVISLGEALKPNPIQRRIAADTFDFLTGQMIRDGMVAACRVGDESGIGRSLRSSFSPRRTRDVLGGYKDWAQDNLGLKLGDNPLMVPHLVSEKSFEDPFEKAMKLMREDSGDSVKLSGIAKLNVNGFVAARLIETARLWNDRNRLQAALAIVDGLHEFRLQDRLYPSRGSLSPGASYLGDYTAYCDAMLQDFLATGRIVSFQNGLTMMRQTLHIFSGDFSGEFVTRQRPTSLLGPQDTLVPEVVDVTKESCTAQIIRLLKAYGRLLGPTSEGSEFQQRSYTAMNLFAGLIDEGGADVGGYYCAAAQVVDDAYAVCVGPQSQELSDQFYRRVPTRFVAAAYGPVRKDLQNRAPGVYVIRDGALSGPFTVEQAAQRLPAVATLDVPPN